MKRYTIRKVDNKWGVFDRNENKFVKNFEEKRQAVKFKRILDNFYLFQILFERINVN